MCLWQQVGERQEGGSEAGLWWTGVEAGAGAGEGVGLSGAERWLELLALLAL